MGLCFLTTHTPGYISTCIYVLHNAHEQSNVFEDSICYTAPRPRRSYDVVLFA